MPVCVCVCARARARARAEILKSQNLNHFRYALTFENS